MEVGSTCGRHEWQQMDSKLNGKSDTGRGAEKGQEDGPMTSNNGKGQHGLEKQELEIDNSGQIW